MLQLLSGQVLGKTGYEDGHEIMSTEMIPDVAVGFSMNVKPSVWRSTREIQRRREGLAGVKKRL